MLAVTGITTFNTIKWTNLQFRKAVINFIVINAALTLIVFLLATIILQPVQIIFSYQSQRCFLPAMFTPDWYPDDPEETSPTVLILTGWSAAPQSAILETLEGVKFSCRLLAAFNWCWRVFCGWDAPSACSKCEDTPGLVPEKVMSTGVVFSGGNVSWARKKENNYLAFIQGEREDHLRAKIEFETNKLHLRCRMNSFQIFYLSNGEANWGHFMLLVSILLGKL